MGVCGSKSAPKEEEDVEPAPTQPNLKYKVNVQISTDVKNKMPESSEATNAAAYKAFDECPDSPNHSELVFSHAEDHIPLPKTIKQSVEDKVNNEKTETSVMPSYGHPEDFFSRSISPTTQSEMLFTHTESHHIPLTVPLHKSVEPFVEVPEGEEVDLNQYASYGNTQDYFLCEDVLHDEDEQTHRAMSQDMSSHDISSKRSLENAGCTSETQEIDEANTSAITASSYGNTLEYFVNEEDEKKKKEKVCDGMSSIDFTTNHEMHILDGTEDEKTVSPMSVSHGKINEFNLENERKTYHVAKRSADLNVARFSEVSFGNLHDFHFKNGDDVHNKMKRNPNLSQSNEQMQLSYGNILDYNNGNSSLSSNDPKKRLISKGENSSKRSVGFSEDQFASYGNVEEYDIDPTEEQYKRALEHDSHENLEKYDIGSGGATSKDGGGKRHAHTSLILNLNLGKTEMQALEDEAAMQQQSNVVDPHNHDDLVHEMLEIEHAFQEAKKMRTRTAHATFIIVRQEQTMTDLIQDIHDLLVLFEGAKDFQKKLELEIVMERVFEKVSEEFQIYQHLITADDESSMMFDLDNIAGGNLLEMSETSDLVDDHNAGPTGFRSERDQMMNTALS